MIPAYALRHTTPAQGPAAEGEERVRAAYGSNYGRLVAVKNKYDPTNFFRLNQNSQPTV